jgi:hypothetical protein
VDVELDAADDEAAYRAAAAEAIAEDPVAAYAYNPGQRRFFDKIHNPCPTLTIVEFLKGNGSGGSWGVITALSAIMFGTDNPLFQGAPFGELWPFPHRSARLITTSESLKDTGPIQTAMRHLFPQGRWTQTRGVGKQYFSEGETIPLEGRKKWTWDCMTYNQDVLEFASANKDLIILSEPPPEKIFQEALTRLRGRGIVLVDMTQLDMAQFNAKLLEDGLKLNGKVVGDVRHTYMHHHEACADHFEGGHRTHESIEAEYALWVTQDPTIAEARASGKALRLSGLIYPMWGDKHEVASLEQLGEFHVRAWKERRVKLSCVVDPHDRKPWAVNFFATFPNDDVLAFAEWPQFRFHEVKVSPLESIDDYRFLLLDMQDEIGRPIDHWLMDPRFGAAAKTGEGKSPKEMMNDPCRGCREKHGPNALEKCPHRLSFRFPPYMEIRHAPLRGLLGNPEKGVRAKFYALKDFCPNLCYGMRHYAWKENKDPAKGLSEKAELVHKDFPDLPRYLKDAGLDKYPDQVVDVDLRLPVRTAKRKR